MIVSRPIRRLDRFDYESVGLDERWYIHKTAEMLTSFEMETKGYYGYDDQQAIYSKIFDKYIKYIMNILSSNYVASYTPNEAELLAKYPEIDSPSVVDSKTTSFSQDRFVTYIESNNKLNIDIVELKRFLSGEGPLISSEETFRNEATSRATLSSEATADDMSIEPHYNTVRLIKATIEAITCCIDSEGGTEVSFEEVLSYLELKGFSDINEPTKQEIYALIPKAIRAAAIPLDIKDKRRYGILKNEKVNQQYVIRATVEATRHMSELTPSAEINAAGMYDWLHSKGYKDLTNRMHEHIWQALPSTNKKPAGAPTKKQPKK